MGILAIVVFILILGVLVFVHEFGHFIAAKKAGIKVEEFSLGFPPRIFKKKIGETVYTIGLIPLGGYVSLWGEENVEEKHLKDPRSFVSQSPLKKAIVIAAGVVMNALLAIIIFYFIVGFSSFTSYQNLVFDYNFPAGIQNNYPIISKVVENSPAQKQGLERNDIIIERNGSECKGLDSFVEFVDDHKGEKISLKAKDLRSREVKKINLLARENPPENEGSLGIKIGKVAEIEYSSTPEKLTAGFLHFYNLTDYSLAAIGHLIETSLAKKSVKPVAKGVAGPVGILAMVSLVLEVGIVPLFNLIALISLALAVVNILPFPALDGGRMMFVIYEAIARKRVPPKVENTVNLIGFVILMILFVLVVFKDILQFKDILF